MPGRVAATKRVPLSTGSAMTSAYEPALQRPPGSSSTVHSASGGPVSRSSQSTSAMNAYCLDHDMDARVDDDRDPHENHRQRSRLGVSRLSRHVSHLAGVQAKCPHPMHVVRTAQIRSKGYRLRMVPGKSPAAISKLWQSLRPRLGTTGCVGGPRSQTPGPPLAFVRNRRSMSR